MLLSFITLFVMPFFLGISNIVVRITNCPHKWESVRTLPIPFAHSRKCVKE